MMRILITGASGAGTSTLGRALAERVGCDFLDADDYYWIPTQPPFTEKREHASRLALLVAALAQSPDCVLAGSIVGWGSELEQAFSLIVFLTVPAPVRVERLRRREIAQLGHADPVFLEWAAQYDEGRMEGRSLAKHEAWLAMRSCRVLRIDGDTSVGERLARVSRAMLELAD